MGSKAAAVQRERRGGMGVGKVLVTGATGFTGGALARRLASDGTPVRALVRDTARAAALAPLRIEIVEGDLRDPASLCKALNGVDSVYHIAGLFRHEGVERQAFEHVNAKGVQHLLDASIAAGVTRFVHCSTVGVHGHVAHPPATEDAPLAPSDPYQLSKLEGERIAARYIAEERLPISIFRPAGIYGPGDLRFVKLFRGVKRGRFPMIGSGQVLYHCVYIDDLVDGIIKCGTLDAAIGETFILAGPEYTTLNDLVGIVAAEFGTRPPWLKIPLPPVYWAAAACEAICRSLKLEPPLHRRRVDFFAKSRAFDISKARRILGYDPQMSVREGVALTAAWYAEHGLL